MSKEIYIHYGAKHFDKTKGFPIKNRISIWNKPQGGLWASNIKSEFGWKDWCKQEDFADCREENSFKFILSDDANVYHIYCAEDVGKLPEREVNGKTCLLSPDFEKIVENGYDAIEFHLSEEKEPEDFLDGLYYKLYGWDCDSIVILNPDIVIEITNP